MITIEELAECLALPIALYPSFPFGRPQIVAYYEMFKDADITKQELLEAVKGAVKESTYFPTVAGIYAFIDKRETPIPPRFSAIEAGNAEAIPWWRRCGGVCWPACLAPGPGARSTPWMRCGATAAAGSGPANGRRVPTMCWPGCRRG